MGATYDGSGRTYEDEITRLKAVIRKRNNVVEAKIKKLTEVRDASRQVLLRAREREAALKRRADQLRKRNNVVEARLALNAAGGRAFTPAFLMPERSAKFLAAIKRFYCETASVPLDLAVVIGLPSAVPYLCAALPAASTILDCPEGLEGLRRPDHGKAPAVDDLFDDLSPAFARAILGRFDLIACGDAWHAAQIEPFVAHHRIYKILNDKRYLAPVADARPAQAPEDGYVVCYGAGLDNVDVVRAAAHFKTADASTRIMVVAHPDRLNGLRAELLAQANGLGLNEEAFYFVDAMSAEALIGVLQASKGLLCTDALISPVTNKKVIPNRFFDAAAANTPLIFTKPSYFASFCTAFGLGGLLEDVAVRTDDRETLRTAFLAASAHLSYGTVSWNAVIADALPPTQPETDAHVEARKPTIAIFANKNITANPRIALLLRQARPLAGRLYLVHPDGYDAIDATAKL